MNMLLTMLKTFGKALSYQLDGTAFLYLLWIYLLRSEQQAYLSSRVTTAYTLLYFLTYGDRTSATLMNPETVTTLKTFAETCIKSAIDGQPEIQEKYSTQLWLLLLYLIALFGPAFDGFSEARIKFPGATHSVAGAASGKLWVIPKRSKLFTDIDNRGLKDTITRHHDAVAIIDGFISRIKPEHYYPAGTTRLHPNEKTQLDQLDEMWRLTKESPLIEDGIPVDNFPRSIEILEKLIAELPRWFLPASASSSGSSLGSSLSISSRSSSSHGSSSSPMYGVGVKSGYDSSSIGSNSSSSVTSVIAPRSASSGYDASYFNIDAFKSLPTDAKKQTILGIMVAELRGDDASRFIHFSPEDEHTILIDYVTEFGEKNDPYKEYMKLGQSMEIGGGSRRKVFQRRTKKQKNNNNKKYKKTKSEKKSKNNNKKQSRKPSKKRHPLKTNANTKRKKH